MERRSLLKLGAGGALLLAITGGALSLLQPGLADGRLTAAGRAVFAAVARAVLGPLLPAQPGARAVALADHLQRLDVTLAGLPPAMQAEISQLVALLASAPGRLAFAGLLTPWERATVAELQAMLEALRGSSVALRQQAYLALRDLSNAAWFADRSSWGAIGYPGPLDV
jgi:hypothetical protein